MNAKVKKRYGVVSLTILAAICGLACVYPAVHPEPLPGYKFDSGHLAWIISASGLVLLMTPGLAFFYGGMVRAKNMISTMLQSFIALGVISILWYVVGFSLAFGDSIGGIIGNPMTHFMFDGVGTAASDKLGISIGGVAIPFILFAAFQLKFAIITPALITGSFAERVRFWGYLVFICLFCMLIYCPLAHWTWHPEGFMFKWGVLDFAGGTVVHISAGFAALAGAMYLGPRKFNLEEEANKPANIPFVLIGTGLLWFGWFGFNAGSALEASPVAVRALINTHLASAAAMITWVLLDVVQGRKVSALGACIGAVVGLVAITPGAGFVDYGPALFIGFFASVVCGFAVHTKEKLKLDDTLDVFPCHGIGGIVGMILTGVFAKYNLVDDIGPGLMYGGVDRFLVHLKGLAVVSVFTFGGSLLIYKITDMITPIRVTEEHEALGLDISQHRESV
jgi:Amt family ammonium transporter